MTLLALLLITRIIDAAGDVVELRVLSDPTMTLARCEERASNDMAWRTREGTRVLAVCQEWEPPRGRERET